MLCQEDKCTGCMACYNICPQEAIQIIQNKEGFYYPKIEESKCTKCGLCSQSCPELNKIQNSKRYRNRVFAAWNLKNEIRNNSSSGGIFYELAKWCLDREGTVFGVEWDVDFNVKHCRITSQKDIVRLHGSKYVQSDIGKMYYQVKKDLMGGKNVLFSGVPCQIAGLKGYLKKEYDNLITCEIICHGTPSPGVFREHLRYLEKKYQGKVTAISFRYKTETRSQNIRFLFNNSKVYEPEDPMLDYYYYGFQAGVLLRNSCYQCQYTGVKRIADISLGDFWGLDPGVSKHDKAGKYPSLIWINSEMGEKLFYGIKDKIYYAERDIYEAVEGNLHFRRSVPKHKKRSKFFAGFGKNNYDALANKYLIQSWSFKESFKKIIGPTLTRKMLRILKR